MAGLHVIPLTSCKHSELVSLKQHMLENGITELIQNKRTSVLSGINCWTNKRQNPEVIVLVGIRGGHMNNINIKVIIYKDFR